MHVIIVAVFVWSFKPTLIGAYIVLKAFYFKSHHTR